MNQNISFELDRGLITIVQWKPEDEILEVYQDEDRIGSISIDEIIRSVM